MKKLFLAALVLLATAASAQTLKINGAGATFPNPIYTKWFDQYHKMVGVSTSVNSPAGVGAKGNEGVAGLVKQTPGSIGYVELIYALQNKIAYGEVQNLAGEWVRASTETVSNAASAAAKNMPKDFRVSITNAPGHDVYPISSCTWLLLQEPPKDVARSRMMVDFMRWALTEGQQFAPQLGYAPLPKEVVALEMDALKKVRQ